MAGDTDKRHWPASSRIQRKSCSFLISVSLRAKIPNFADLGGFRNLRGIPRNSAEFGLKNLPKCAFFDNFPRKMPLFLGICVRVKRPFRGIPRNSRGIPRNSGNGWPIFQTLAIFSSFCSKNRVSSFLSAILACFNPKFPKSTPKRQKKAKSAHRRPIKKNDTFWPVECQKNTNKNENQHRKPPSLRLSASLAAHGTNNGLAILS